MNETDTQVLRKLLDRQEILDCLTRYCRGVDRLDKSILLSAYHPDARDDHGLFVGHATEFWELVHASHGAAQIRTFHTIANHSCELAGDIAHAETYCLYFGRNIDESVDVVGARYIDRLERRNGEWRIADRVCVVDWNGALKSGDEVSPGMRITAEALMKNAPNERSRDDVSYMRPLRVLRESRCPKIQA